MMLVASNSAMAGEEASSRDIEGAYVGLGANFSALTVDETSSYNKASGSSEFSGALKLGYNFKVVKKFMLGIEIETAGNIGSVDIPVTGGKVEVSTSSVLNFSILPGVRLGESSVLYARLGSGSANVTAKGVTTSGTVVSTSSEDKSYTQVGIGYRAMVSQKVSLSTDIIVNSFKDANSSVVSFGAQYNF